MSACAMPPAYDEPAMLILAMNGDHDAFGAIMTRYQPPIYAFIYRTIGDADDAHDLTQDTFVKAHRALPRLGADPTLLAWFHKIAANLCLDVLRRRQRLRWLPWEGPKHDHLLISPIDGGPEPSAVRRESDALVRATLRRMSPRHRRALLLREYAGLGCDEIGAEMGLSRSATKSMLFRARDEFVRVYRMLDPDMAAPARNPYQGRTKAQREAAVIAALLRGEGRRVAARSAHVSGEYVRELVHDARQARGLPATEEGYAALLAWWREQRPGEQAGD